MPVHVDMHSHSEYSFDSHTTLVAQAGAIRAAGLQDVCTTDHDTIEGALRLREMMDAVKAQGGLVSVPHPFSRTRARRLRRDALDRLWPQVDCIEVFNGRETFAGDNERAARYASERNILRAAGSDAHDASAIGSTFVSIEPFDGSQGFLKALATGVITGRLSRPPGLLDRARLLLGG